MNSNKIHCFLILQLSCVVSATSAASQSQTSVVWEGEIEIETLTVIDTDEGEKQPSEISANLDIGAIVSFSDRLDLFGSVQVERIDDPESERSSSEAHVFVDELGLSYTFADTSLSVGKITPVFGTAFDAAYGFFSGSLASDYELDGQIGGLAQFDLGGAGYLDFGVFYADDTRLNRSLTSDLDPNSDDEGRVGDTGKLNNATLQWSWVSDNTEFSLGGRLLSRAKDDAQNELGAVVSLTHFFEQAPLDVLAEFAIFHGWEGSSDNARFLTLNAGYAFGDLALSGVLARREIGRDETTNLASLALEYEFENGVTLGTAIASVENDGSVDQLLGFNVIFEFGD
ncbi:porin [Ruegeria sp. 2012CJ41-6]|uniref:Porin n=1 Tax=Ruegeria spongiae TaxID=2942209 RepID=A0ABT0Q8H0_9RHOB|nr:porin [Ruegeria spongiae]MCL6285852.1 porin [Ruegeria spongiae]